MTVSLLSLFKTPGNHFVNAYFLYYPTVEELNLINIYIYEDLARLIEEMSDALPYMDEDMRSLADRTLEMPAL